MLQVCLQSKEWSRSARFLKKKRVPEKLIPTSFLHLHFYFFIQAEQRYFRQE
jgi:hypothetical protein